MNLRFQLVSRRLKSKGLDALLVSNHYNVLYLAGFKGLSPTEREAWVLVTRENIYLFTDARYQIKLQAFQTKQITAEKNITAHLREIVKNKKIEKIGFEIDDLKVAEYNTFSKYLSFIPTDKMIIKLRAVKEQNEIDNIQRACKITDECLKQIIPYVKPGTTEAEIAFKIEFWLKQKNYDLAFYPIVAVDENAAIPHYDIKTNGAAKIKNGSVVLIDFGAVYNNYLSDMTRMVFVGKPEDEIVKTYEILRQAQQKTLAMLSNTTDPKQIDSTCRQYLKKRKLLNFPHSLGHGVGLEIHEYPQISAKSDDTITKNQIFTIEPAVYIPGKFGMRIEDTVWMKNNLQPEVLTKFGTELLIV